MFALGKNTDPVVTALFFEGHSPSTWKRKQQIGGVNLSSGSLFRASYLCFWLSQRGGEAASMALGMGCGDGCGRNKRNLSPGKELSSHRELWGKGTPASLERFF